MQRVLTIDPSEALAHGLPPARIRLDLTGVPMVETRFAQPHAYFTLSGPPGGPLYMELLSLPGPIDGPGALEQAVRVRLPWAKPILFGRNGEVVVHGVRRKAVHIAHGEGHASTVACAVHLAVPAGSATAPGLLLVFGHGGRPEHAPDCAEVAAHPALAAALAGLTWEAMPAA